MNTLIKLAVVMLLLAGSLGIAWKWSEPEPLAAGLDSTALLQRGPWRVGSVQHELLDSSRNTDANGDFAGSPGRQLHTRIWYPLDPVSDAVASGPLPLIAYSHGFFGNSGEPAYLAEYLASHGYVTVAADFPLTNFRAPGGANVFDVINQPGDISFLIDTLLAWNAEAGNAFHERIDADRIALAGLSLGGMTTTLAAYHPRVREPRARAALSIAGPLQLFGRAFFEQSQLPFMMIAGDIDAMVPYPENARPVLERVNNARLVSVAAASHTGFADQASMLRWMDNADSIGCFFIAGKTPEAGDDTSYYDRLGSVEEGILRNMENRLCRMDPLPPAISPLQQHRVVMLAARAFFEAAMNPDPGERARFARYLDEQLAKDMAGVTVEQSQP